MSTIHYQGDRLTIETECVRFGKAGNDDGSVATARVGFRGELTIETLGRQGVGDPTERLVGSGCRQVLFDLGAVDFMDSFAYGYLMSARKRLADAGVRLALVVPSERDNQALRMIQMHRLIPVFRDLPAALHAEWPVPAEG